MGGRKNSRSDNILDGPDLKGPQNGPMNVGGATSGSLHEVLNSGRCRETIGRDNVPHLSGSHTSPRQCYHGNKGHLPGGKVCYLGEGT